MALNLTLPQLGEKSTTKDYIISILGYDWPLTIKKIYNLIKKKYGYSVTYQAVYKTVNELNEKGVLEKKKEGYQINLKWLKELHSYTEIVETNYYTKNRLNLIDGIKSARKEGNINILTFETFFDVEKYLYYLQKHYILSSKKKEVICVHHNNEWRPLFYLRAEYNWIKKLKEKGHKTYILCASNSLVDKWCANFYRSLGCKIKTNVNCSSTCELMIFGDVVIQIYLPSQIKNSLKNNFSKIKDITNLKQAKLIKDIFEKKTNIKVIINKDKEISEEIKKETLGYF